MRAESLANREEVHRVDSESCADVYAGLGASASFFVSSAEKVAGFGSLLTIGLCYAFGISFAIIVAAPVSGGHLSPSFTLAFTVFKGFPIRKVPYYILSQLIGGFLAALCVYGVYKQQLVAITAAMRESPTTAAAIFSPSGVRTEPPLRQGGPALTCLWNE